MISTCFNDGTHDAKRVELDGKEEHVPNVTMLAHNSKFNASLCLLGFGWADKGNHSDMD